MVSDVEGSSADNEAAKTVGASLMTGYVPPDDPGDVQGPTSETDASTGLGSGCIVRVVIEPSVPVMEQVVSNQSFSVPQLVTEAYESTMDMEGMVQDMSERKT